MKKICYPLLLSLPEKWTIHELAEVLLFLLLLHLLLHKLVLLLLLFLSTVSLHLLPIVVGEEES